MKVRTLEIEKWIVENKEDFVLPVCNKCMFSDQLKLFFVGGPNSRKDYHLEEGEEFFYQRTGDMVLKVIEQGTPRDLRIREGEMFLLPSRVEHSPQRFADTIGFVLERARENTEFDCVRYFVDSSTQRLFERWFHLNDVVRDLPPLIRAFMSSEENRLGQPGSKSFIVNAPYEPVPQELSKPLNLRQFITDNADTLKKNPVQVYGTPQYSTNVFLYGEGEHPLDSQNIELLIWTLENSQAELETSDERRRLESESMTLCPAFMRCQLKIVKGNVITLQMGPRAN